MCGQILSDHTAQIANIENASHDTLPREQQMERNNSIEGQVYSTPATSSSHSLTCFSTRAVVGVHPFGKMPFEVVLPESHHHSG